VTALGTIYLEPAIPALSGWHLLVLGLLLALAGIGAIGAVGRRRLPA
jgi:hypothetical protein